MFIFNKEHHDLEDILHKNREEIANLRTNLKPSSENNHDRIYFDDIALLEKRAEFQALDLAINDRRRHLYHLELKKKKNYNDLQCLDDSKSQYDIQVFFIQEFILI